MIAATKEEEGSVAAADPHAFLSYHSLDLAQVDSIRAALESQGLRFFFDRESLQAGLPWFPALEQKLTAASAIVIFLGPSGLGPWQRREMWLALDLQARAESRGLQFRIVPVLLPGADPTPGFLSLNTYVDLRGDLRDPAAISQIYEALIDGSSRAEAPRPQVCPYVALRPFREEDQAFFFWPRRVFRHAVVENKDMSACAFDRPVRKR